MRRAVTRSAAWLRAHPPRWLGWVVLLACVAGVSAGYLLVHAVGHDVKQGATFFVTITSFMAYPTVGALIVWYRPRNTVGWIFCMIGVGTATTSFSAGFVQRALVTGADAQLATGLVDAIGNGMWVVNLGLGALLLYVFPDGRLPSHRWRPFFWLLVATLVATSLSDLLHPGPLEQVGNQQLVVNPLGIRAAAPLLNAGDFIGHLLFVPLVLIGVASLIVRYRHATGVQRQQIKWFVYGAGLMVLIIAVSVIVIPQENALSDVAFDLGFVMLPIGAGIGVLRYRLYDIDVIIRRTLIYGSLTVLLAGVYFGSVVLMQQITHAITGQQTGNNPLVIVLSTLLIAALFTPLRRRVQATIDRRFYRAKYDATRTLEAFAASLRAEVDLADLSDHLIGAVEQTMQPAHVSLWLAKASSRDHIAGRALGGHG